MGIVDATNAKRWMENLVSGKSQNEPARSPSPGPDWVGLKLAATWLSGKFAPSTVVDGKDTRLEQAAAMLIDWGRAKKIEMLTLDENLYNRKGDHLIQHFFKRVEIEAIVYKSTTMIELSVDPAGAYANRKNIDAPTPAGQAVIVVEGVVGKSEAPSPLIPMPSPVRRRR